MNKKYRFRPTKEIKSILHPKLAERDNEISNCWEEELMMLFPECFEEIKEPVILSDEELIEELKNSDFIWYDLIDCEKEALLEFRSNCVENGRLREWKSKEQIEVRKALENITEKAELFTEDHSCNDFTEYIKQAKKALSNLKPPYER
jgi:hypothetical protein